MRFSIRDVLLVTVIVALVLGWWVDHQRLAQQIEQLNGRPYATLDLEWQPVENLGPGSHSIWLNPPTSSAPTPNPPKK